MNKADLIAIGIGILLILAIYWVGSNVDADINTSTKKLSCLLGKKVILEKDTLIIVDYSFFKDALIFSNGKEISREYATMIIISK